MAPRKQKRPDEANTRSQQSLHAPMAEALAIGTAAGGLVLGTMQAQGALPADPDDTAIPHPADTPPGDRPAEAAPEPMSDAAPAAQLAATAPLADQVQPAEAPAPALVVPFVPPQSDAGAAPANAIPSPIQSQLVSDLSEQMTATLVKVIGHAEPGQSPADLAQSIAGDIVASAQQIVAGLDIGALLVETQHLGEGIIARLDAPALVDQALGATNGLEDILLADISNLPSGILGDTGAALADLPTSLLGNDGPEGSGGLLSEIFYADGASDSLAIPTLSEGAATLVTDLGDGTTGLLGLSYTEMPDNQGPHGLNALSLL